MGGAAEANATLRLAEALTPVSVSAQQPAATRAAEVEAGATLRELLTQRVAQGPIARVFSNSGV